MITFIAKSKKTLDTIDDLFYDTMHKELQDDIGFNTVRLDRREHFYHKNGANWATPYKDWTLLFGENDLAQFEENW